MKIIAIGGEPATGKSTLVRSLLPFLGSGRTFRYGLLNGLYYYTEPVGKIFVLGKYEPDAVFAGTDRLSMAVQPSAEMFLLHDVANRVVIFEGDRLFNRSFLRRCYDLGHTAAFLLTASHFEKKDRHRERNDNQSERFLKSRETKYKNILEEFPQVIETSNEYQSDLLIIRNTILEFVGIEPPPLGEQS